MHVLNISACLLAVSHDETSIEYQMVDFIQVRGIFRVLRSSAVLDTNGLDFLMLREWPLLVFEIAPLFSMYLL